ncbi:MAG: LacI family DNA-binding transcriptional regulator [Novosphingobium sp.]
MAEVPITSSRKRGTRRAQGAPTVADVASLAGVSPMTVSRVVNRDRAVLPATRERVEQAIASLGYVPNRAARSLAGGRQCRIALVYSNPSASYLSELLVGALAQANAEDAQLLVELWEEGGTVAGLVAKLKAHHVDGVLLPSPLCEDPALLQALHARHIRIVQISPGALSSFADAVTIDDFEAARTITAHLLALGHSRIGFIAGNPAHSQSILRRGGYERALRDAGQEPAPDLMAEADFSYRSGFTAAERLLTLAPRPTAIFASNDDMAAAAVAAAHRRGLDVPADLSICGFDDTAIASSTWPELTTIRQPIADMARKAVQMLAAAIQGDEESPSGQLARLPFTLVRRASDGPPPPA